MIPISRKGAAGRRSRERAKPLRAVVDVRWSRVRTARSRIASHYYDRRDVQSRTIDAVLRELRPR